MYSHLTPSLEASHLQLISTHSCPIILAACLCVFWFPGRYINCCPAALCRTGLPASACFAVNFVNTIMACHPFFHDHYNQPGRLLAETWNQMLQSFWGKTLLSHKSLSYAKNKLHINICPWVTPTWWSGSLRASEGTYRRFLILWIATSISKSIIGSYCDQSTNLCV